jgi:hypothetical protein
MVWGCQICVRFEVESKQTTMAARVIHFGIDACYRLNVLQSAGYDIVKCGNLVQFRAALDAEADAILFDDSDGSVPETLICLARSRCSTPIVLFPNHARAYPMNEVDLVVPTLTPPQEWLLDVANLIIRSRQIRACSQILQEESGQLRRESAAVLEKSGEEWNDRAKNANATRT